MAEPAGAFDAPLEGSRPPPANARFADNGLTVAGVPADILMTAWAGEEPEGA